MTSPPPLKPYPWRLFWLLFVGEVLAILAVVPVGIELLGPVISKQPLPNFPLPLLILIGVIQNLALLAFTVWLGLKLSRRLGLGAPLLESWVTHHSEFQPRPKKILKSGILTGVLVGIPLLLTLFALMTRLPNLPLAMVARTSVWKRFLMCFYGGVYEELLTRLFLLTLIAWIANRSWRNSVHMLSSSAFWFANILAAIIFGLGHLPSASLFMPITPLVVVAALLLNGVAGIAFGYLYRRDGLEAAMIAHFTCDLVIWVVGPVLIKS
jgi:membrane protease YdiL (CAAX protease family)